MQTLPRLGLAVLLSLILSGAIAACGSGSGSGSTASDSGGSTSAESESSGGGSRLASFETKLEAVAKSTNTDPPANAPKPEPGKTIMALIYGLEAESGKTFATSMEKAGAAIGWNVDVVDGEFSSNKYLEAIRRAVAEKVDGIVVYVIDCSAIQAAAVEAKEAGIPIVYAEGFDCDEIESGGPETGYTIGKFNTFDESGSADLQEYLEAAGEMQAAAAIVANEGEMKAIALNENDARVTEDITAGFLNSAEECENCSVEKQINWVGEELGPPLQQKVEQALLEAPEANTIYGNYDDPVIDSAAPAARAAGRQDLYITGTAGYAPMMELIREGHASMTVGLPVEWFGWATMDRFNRIFHGETEIPNTGMGLELVDSEHNLPPQGQAWAPNVDFEADYEKAWGVR